MPNTTVCHNSTLLVSSPLGYTGFTAFRMYTERLTSLGVHFWPATCIPVSPAMLNCCSQREFTLFSPRSPHILPQRSLLPMVSPCNPVPFPTVLQISVLRRARGNRDRAQKRCCREEWVSQQLESQRH